MISPRKSSSSYSLMPENRYKIMPSATKSCESLYSNTSSSKGSTSVMFRRKTPPISGLIGSRQPSLIPAVSEVRQRVLSARRLRMKTYQNQLADAQQTIAELANENRILRTLHKRQDSALAKYESTNAELPQLLHSHAEELRVWQVKYRNLQTLNKDLELKLKQKDAVILSLSDQNKYYNQLNKNKNLEERQKLTEKLKELETRLQEKDNDLKLLARKVQLEEKNLKHQLQNEQKKTKNTLIKLEKARLEISGYRKLDELNLTDSLSTIGMRRANNSAIDNLKFSKAYKKSPAKNDFNQISKLDDAEFTMPQQQTHTINEEQQETEDETGDEVAIANDDDTMSIENLKMSSAIVPKQLDHGIGTDIIVLKRSDSAKTIVYTEDEDFDSAHNAKVDLLSQDAGSLEDEDDLKSDNDILIPKTQTSDRIKEELWNIHKQISDDYKEREAFLDTFCRQATNSALRDEPATKRNTISHSLPQGQKNKLLAALKAIDEKPVTKE